MFGINYIRSMNNAATIQGLLDKRDAFIYEVDEIATDVAYEQGWTQTDQGEWRDADGDKVDDPLTALMHLQLSDDMETAIVDRAIEAYNQNYG